MKLIFYAIENENNYYISFINAFLFLELYLVY